MQENTSLTVRNQNYEVELYGANDDFFEGVKIQMPRYKANKDGLGIVDANGEARKSIKVVMFPWKEISRVLFPPAETKSPDKYWCRCPKAGHLQQIMNPDIADKKTIKELEKAGCMLKCAGPLQAMPKDLNADNAVSRGFCKFAFFGADGTKPPCNEMHNHIFWDVERECPFVLAFSRSALSTRKKDENSLFKFLSDNFSGARKKKLMTKYMTLTTEKRENDDWVWSVPILKLTDELLTPEFQYEMTQQALTLKQVFQQFINAEEVQSDTIDEEPAQEALFTDPEPDEEYQD